MAKYPSGKPPTSAARPKIWAEGDQRPTFNMRAFGKASLLLSRLTVAPILAWAARRTRHVAVNVKNGVGRIPEARLGRAARILPSQLRVAAWIKNMAAVLSHASATADPNVARGNALVAEVERHLWSAPAITDPIPPTDQPVLLAEPMHPDDDPLATIRDDLESAPEAARATPDKVPAMPGPLATGAIQVSGYALGLLSSFAALPWGLVRAGWLHIKGVDLRRIEIDG